MEKNTGFEVDGIHLSGRQGRVRFRSVSNPAAKPGSGVARAVYRHGREAPNALRTKPSESVIYLVSCVSAKRQAKLPAAELYISDWFMKALNYVQSLHQPWFILSAKYGLLHPDEVIEPYELTLKHMSVRERKVWAARDIRQLDQRLPNAERIVVLASKQYREFLMGYLERRAFHVETPMAAMRTGEQKQWLSRETGNEPP